MLKAPINGFGMASAHFHQESSSGHLSAEITWPTKRLNAEETRTERMVLWSYPPTPKQLAVTIGCVVTGASLIATGAYLSLANIAPQQARVKARSQYIKNRLRKMLDD